MSEPGSPPAPWFAPVPADESGSAIQILPLLEGPESFLDATARVVRAVESFFTQIETGWRRAQRNHRRAACLDAYRRRDRWRTADVPHLMRLGVCRPAERRIQRILASKNPGRSVVKKYLPLEAVIMEWLEFYAELIDDQTPPRRRLALLKQMRWWPYVVEGLYRSEHDAARTARRKSPSEYAEARVAARLVLSAATVHKLCEKARRERRAGVNAADNPPLRMVDLEIWAQIGGELWPEFLEADSLDSGWLLEGPTGG